MFQHKSLPCSHWRLSPTQLHKSLLFPGCREIRYFPRMQGWGWLTDVLVKVRNSFDCIACSLHARDTALDGYAGQNSQAWELPYWQLCWRHRPAGMLLTSGCSSPPILDLLSWALGTCLTHFCTPGISHGLLAIGTSFLTETLPPPLGRKYGNCAVFPSSWFSLLWTS